MASAIGSMAATSSTPLTTAASKSILGKDDFLKLLLQQLKYQDPLDPMSGAEYAAQLAQFSSVEQLANINSSLTTSIDANYVLAQSVNNTMAASLIGKDVKMTSAAFTFDGTNDVSVGYTLPGSVSGVTIGVYDNTGKKVRDITGDELTVGDHEQVWDGKNNDGQTVASGNYTFKVEATDANGGKVSAGAFYWGTVDAVRFTTSGTVVVIDDTEVSLSNILEIGGKRG